MKSRKDRWISKEWESFKRYCINKEAVPRFKNYNEFSEFYQEVSYYGGHKNPFEFVLLDGELVALDYGISDIIKRLNREGYCTMFCCSGHSDNHWDGYIYFDERSTPRSKKLKKKVKAMARVYSSSIEFYQSSSDVECCTIRFKPKNEVLDEKLYYSQLSEELENHFLKK